MRRPNFARFKPCAAGRKKRLQQYLEAERLEFREAIDVHRKTRNDKAQQVDLELFREGRDASNWLENREMRMLPLMLEHQRSLIETKINIRTELGRQCPELLSDSELAKLQETILQSVRIARQARRDDYTHRAAAAGVPMRRPEQSAAAAY